MTKRINILIFVVLLFSVYISVFAKRFSPGERCINLSHDEKFACITHETDKFLAKKNVDAALTFLHNYQLEDKSFYATDCHGIAHYIGDKAFVLYKQGVRVDFGKYSSVCVYGFYHAFTSSFILSGQFKDASDFCLGLENKSVNKAIGCYHGIGHGAVYDFNEDYGIIDPLQIINKGVELCEKVLSKDYMIHECVTGVYDGIGDIVLDSVYRGLTPDKIYAYCTGQPVKYKSSCYENVSHLAYRKTLISFSDLVDYVLKSPKISDKEAAIKGLSTIYVVDLKGGNIEDGISVCQKLELNLKKACLRNMGYKFAADDIYGRQYEVVKNFCSNKLLSPEERSICFEPAIDYLSEFYTHQKLYDKCSSDKDAFYRNLCINHLR